MEVESINHSEVSSFENLDELSRFVDPEFIWSNTTRADYVRLLSQVDPTFSLQVEMSKSEEIEAIEKYLKAGFESIPETVPTFPTPATTNTLDSCLKTLPARKNPIGSNSLSKADMDLLTVPNVDQKRFVKAPVPAPTPSLKEYQKPVLPPSLPRTSTTIYPPFQYQLQNNRTTPFYPRQQASNMPPPVQPQQYRLHPHQKICATPRTSYPKKMKTPKVQSKKMNNKHPQDQGDCQLVVGQFICSFPGCRKVYVKRGHFFNHQKIHEVE